MKKLKRLTLECLDHVCCDKEAERVITYFFGKDNPTFEEVISVCNGKTNYDLLEYLDFINEDALYTLLCSVKNQEVRNYCWDVFFDLCDLKYREMNTSNEVTYQRGHKIVKR